MSHIPTALRVIMIKANRLEYRYSCLVRVCSHERRLSTFNINHSEIYTTLVPVSVTLCRFLGMTAYYRVCDLQGGAKKEKHACLVSSSKRQTDKKTSRKFRREGKTEFKFGPNLGFRTGYTKIWSHKAELRGGHWLGPSMGCVGQAQPR